MAGISALPGTTASAGLLWDGGGNTNDWSNNNNWNPNGAPVSGPTTAVTFAGSVRLTPNLDSNRQVQSVLIGSTAGANPFTFGTANGSTLTIDNGGIINGDADTVTFTHALSLSASQTWDAAVGAITVTGNVNLNANTLTIAGGLATTMSGVASGTGGITKTTASTLTLSGPAANTYTGTTTVNAGALNLSKSAGAAIAGNLTIGDGSGSDVVALLAANQIGGSGTITINSSGVLQFNSFADQVNNVVIAGGQITTSTATGALQLGGALSTNAAATSAVISGPGSLVLFTNNKTFTVADGAAAVDLDISSAIGQDIAGRSITKSGAGTMRLSGANSFSGGLTLSSGTLILNSNTAAGAGTLTLGGGTVTTENSSSLANAVNITVATLLQTGSATMTFSGALSGSGALTIGSSGVAGNLQLSGASASTNTGTITVTNGLLSLGKTAGVNAVGGDIILGDSSSALPLAQLKQSSDNQIADTATITVRRSGIYDMGALGDHSETIGSLVLEDGTVFGPGSAGRLTITGSITSNNVTPGAQSLLAGLVSLGGGTRSVTVNGGTLNLGASVDNGGLSYSGTGTLHLNGNNTLTSFTHAGTGTVELDTNSAIGGTVTAVAGATRNFAIVGAGPLNILTQPFVLDGPANITTNQNVTWAGSITGAATLSKDGTAMLALNTFTSTYTGVTNINQGTLLLLADGVLGSTAGGTTIAPGATMQVRGVNYLTREPVTLDGGGLATASLENFQNSSTFGGPITLASATIIDSLSGSLTLNDTLNLNGSGLTIGDGSITFAGNITGAGSVTKSGSGIATLSGPNSYVGATNVLAGTLRVANSSASAIPDASAVTIQSGATLEFAGNETVGTIQTGSLGTILIDPGNTATVQAGTFGGAISGSAGTFSKNGGGTLTLLGASLNGFAGTTQVLGGTLNLNKSLANGAVTGSLVIGDSSTSTPTAFVTLGANDQIGDTVSVTIRRSGVLDLATGSRTETIGALTLEDGTLATGGGTLTISNTLTSNNVTPGAVSTISGNLNLGGTARGVVSNAGNTLNIDAVVSNGAIAYSGAGTLNLTAANIFSGGFQHGGSGTVNIGNDAALGTGTVSTTGGGTRIFSIAGAVARTLANGFALSGTAQFTLPVDLTLNGAIVGVGGISKDGAANLTLTNSGNTYSGATNVTGGKLIVTANNALGSTSAGTTIGPGAGLELSNVNYAAAEPLTLNSSGVTDALASTGGSSSTWAGPITLLNHARLNAANGGLSVTGAIAAGDFTLTLDDGFDSTYSGAITGTALASLQKQGSGTATLSGGNTISNLAVNQGTLSLARAGGDTLPDNASVSVAAGATLNFATTDTIGTLNGDGVVTIQPSVAAAVQSGSFGGVITGSGTDFIKTSSGTLTLSGPASNTFSGVTQVLAGTLNLNKSVSNGAITAALAIGDNAVATPNAFVTLGSNEQIGNSVAVTVHRSGVLDLASGNRSETIATLRLEDGTVTTGAGTLTVLGTISSDNLAAGAVSTISGNLNLGGASRVLTMGGTGTGTLNLDAVVSSGGLWLQGNGTLNLTGANTFGLGFEHGGGGVVNIGNNAAFGAGTVSTTAVGTRVFSVINGAETVANAFSLNGPAHFALPDNLTLTGNISGGGAISKDGVGNLTLGGAGSNYTGTTTISQGKLIVTANNALGGTGSGTTINTGAVLELPGVAYTAAEPLTINGGGSANASLASTSGASTFAGAITLGGNSVISASGGTLTMSGAIALAGFNLTLDGASNSSYNGAISGAGNVIKRGSGTATLGGTNTFSSLSVQAGRARFLGAVNNAMSDSGSVSIDPGATLEVAANEVIDTLAGQVGGNGSIIINTGVGFGVRQGSWSGVISGGGSLNKVIDSTLTLSGVNTFSGGVTVNGGTLRLQGGSALADANIVAIASSGTLDIPVSETIGGLINGNPVGGGVTLGSGAILTVTGGGTFSGVISGAGELVKGSGADLLLRGVNTFTGRTTINGGVVDILAENNLGAVPPSFVADQINLDNNGGLRLGDGTVTIPINRGITIGANGGRLIAGNADTLTIASKLTGAGNVTFAAFGSVPTMPIFALNGTNTTFTGKTIIDDAVVTIASDGNLSAAPASFVADKLTLSNGGTLKVTATMSLPANRGVTLVNGGGAFDVNSAQTLTTLAPITGLGSLNKRGVGTLNLNTSHTFSGKTTIEAGTVIAQQDQNFGAPPLALVPDQLTINAATLRWTTNGPGLIANRGVRLAASSSTINVDAGITMAINGPVSGTGGLTKTGSGTLNLLGTNSYAAATSVGAGKLILNQTFTTNTAIAISAGAVLEMAQAPALTVKTSSVVATGKLDVKDDKLVITGQPVGTFSGSSYSGVTGMIAGAYNFGSWSGSGITTTMPDAQAGLTTLAIASADQAGRDTFGGVSVAPSNVLVMYTYAGDANLDGLIDGGDYGIIDNFAQVPNASGYANGDFNFDGVIDGGDYGIIDNNIQAQGAPFPATAAAPVDLSGVTAVPEPSVCGFAIVAGAATLLRRHRRRRR